MLLNLSYKLIKIIIINIIILFSLLYFVEVIINLKNNSLLKKTKYRHLQELSKINEVDFAFNYLPYKNLSKKKLEILPLSGYENTWTLMCLDEKVPIYFKSDENGFNNQYKNINNEVLLIGDSFVQGMCVKNNFNLSGQLKKLNIRNQSIGIGGNGPLFTLATLKEYGNFYKHNHLIYVITPDNDFADLSREINNPTLMKYLESKDFTQNLMKKKKNKKKIIDNFFDIRVRHYREILRYYHLDLHNIRAFIKNLKYQDINNNLDEIYQYLNDKKIDNIFLNIIDEIISIEEKSGNKVSVVFNIVNPDIVYKDGAAKFNLKDKYFEKINLIKIYLNKKNINYFDFNEYVYKKYNENNIDEISHYNNKTWDHYSAYGYEVLAYNIKEELIK